MWSTGGWDHPCITRAQDKPFNDLSAEYLRRFQLPGLLTLDAFFRAFISLWKTDRPSIHLGEPTDHVIEKRWWERFHKDNLRHLSRFPDFFVFKRILSAGMWEMNVINLWHNLSSIWWEYPWNRMPLSLMLMVDRRIVCFSSAFDELDPEDEQESQASQALSWKRFVLLRG